MGAAPGSAFARCQPGTGYRRAIRDLAAIDAEWRTRRAGQLHQAAVSYATLTGQLGVGPEEAIRVLRRVIAT